MMKLTIILLATFFSDSTNLEQKACDYFFNNIFQSEYKDYKIIEFQNYTDTSKYWGTVYRCKKLDETTKREIISATPDKKIEVRANVNEIKVREVKKNSKRLKIYVYSKIKVGDNYFVLIATYKKFHFAEYYLIMFDKERNILETCKTGEII